MRTFIVADDELLVRVGLRSLADWESAGYRLVGEAADGAEALALAEQLDPDIVVTDIVMPVMDGLELTRRLRAAGSTAGIVVLSCRNDFDSAREALRLGADDYVFKLTLKSAELLEAFGRAAVKRARPPDATRPAGGRAGGVGNGDPGAASPDDAARPEDAVHPEDAFAAFVRAALEAADEPRSPVGGDPVAPSVLGKPHRILAVELSGGAGASSSAPALLRELGRADPAVLAAAAAGDRIFLAVANGGRPSLSETFSRVAEYAFRYLGAVAAGAYSSLALAPGAAAAAVREAADALSRRTFGPGAVLAFADEAAAPAAPQLESERYAAACLELARAVDAYDAPRCARALGEVAASLASGEDSRRLRSLFLDALVPFRLRARALGFDPDAIPGAGAVADVVALARTAAEAAERAASYAEAFVPYALERSGDRREIAEVRRWALADLKRQFAVEDAAAVAGLSPSHFAHVFKDATGLPFIDWVNRSRMERARELLLTTDLLVKEVSEAVGIENPAWFGVLFKRAVGSTPNEVREGRGASCS